jgi:hypothetical protein
VRISIAIFSYDGGLFFGVTGDYDSSSDIDILTAGIERSMTELLGLLPAAAARRKQSRPKRAPSPVGGRRRQQPPSAVPSAGADGRTGV